MRWGLQWSISIASQGNSETSNEAVVNKALIKIKMMMLY